MSAGAFILIMATLLPFVVGVMVLPALPLFLDAVFPAKRAKKPEPPCP